MLVLNATYEPINVCTVRRATVLLLKSKAEVVEVGTQDLHWATGSLPRPVVIRLVTYVRIPRDTHKRKITRRAVFARDGWMCQYCGARTSLTVDHVIPRSKGGGSGWDNIVASCAPCNRRKADRLPHQINMHPRTKPHTPGAHIFIQLASPTIPATWRQYLPPRPRVQAARQLGARGAAVTPVASDRDFAMQDGRCAARRRERRDLADDRLRSVARPMRRRGRRRTRPRSTTGASLTTCWTFCRRRTF